MAPKRCVYGVCTSDSRYYHKPYMKNVAFFHFPHPKKERDMCKRWVNACKRVDFTIDNVNKYRWICSKHFADGLGPTVMYPDPIPATASKNKLEKFAKTRRVLVRNMTDSFVSDHSSRPKIKKEISESTVTDIANNDSSGVNSPTFLECKPTLLPSSHEVNNGGNTIQIGGNAIQIGENTIQIGENTIQCFSKPTLLPSSHEVNNGGNANQIGENAIESAKMENLQLNKERIPSQNFSTESILKSLLKAEEKISCDICKREYKYVKFLEHHIKTMHPRPFNCPTTDNSELDGLEDNTPMLTKTQRTRRFSSNKYCSVHGCKSRTVLGSISLHLFPKDPEMQQIWRTKLKIVRPISDTMSVCSLHFLPSDYFPTYPGLEMLRKKHLKIGSIPSQNLPATTPGWEKILKAENDEKKTTTCDFCNKQFQYSSHLDRHTKAVHPNLFNCSLCEQTFASERARQKHEWCYKDNIFCCDFCNRVFSSNCQLTAHIQYIHGIGQTKGVHHCGECGKCFSEKIGLANHTKIVHANQLLTLSCDFCDEEFYVDRDLVQHMRSVHENIEDSMDIKPAISELNEEDHFCSHCGSRFTIESHLKEHLHNGTCSSRDFLFDGQDEGISVEPT